MFYGWHLCEQKKTVGPGADISATYGSSACTIAERFAQIWGSSFSALSSCFHSPLDVPQSFNQQIQFMLCECNSCFQILHPWDLLLCYDMFIFSTLLPPFGICFPLTTDIASCWMHQIRLDSQPGKCSSSPSWHHPINTLVRKLPCQQGKCRIFNTALIIS